MFHLHSSSLRLCHQNRYANLLHIRESDFHLMSVFIVCVRVCVLCPFSLYLTNSSCRAHACSDWSLLVIIGGLSIPHSPSLIYPNIWWVGMALIGLPWYTPFLLYTFGPLNPLYIGRIWLPRRPIFICFMNPYGIPCPYRTAHNIFLSTESHSYGVPISISFDVPHPVFDSVPVVWYRF